MNAALTSDRLDPTGVWTALTALMSNCTEPAQILAGVVTLARTHVAGTDEAAITLIRHGSPATVATTGGMAVPLDELQYEEGYGPCLDAGRANKVMLIQDTATETRWPRYLPAARDHGLGSSLSLPIPMESYLVGALNLYSTTPAGFNPRSQAVGEALTVHIGAAVANAENAYNHRIRADQLQHAIDARAAINQAQGILMAQRQCTAAEAFDLLRAQSMNGNTKLADVASALVLSFSERRDALAPGAKRSPGGGAVPSVR